MEYFLNLYFWVTLENDFKKPKNLIWGNTKLLDKVFIDLMFLFLSNILQPFLFSFVFWPMCHLDLLLRYMLILYGWHWRMSLPLVLCVPGNCVKLMMYIFYVKKDSDWYFSRRSWSLDKKVFLYIFSFRNLALNEMEW